MEISVAICAFNARDRIEMVLQSLGAQDLGTVGEWELVVIDNASTDNTSDLVKELCEKYRLPLRLFVEPVPGLSNARRRAALEARSDLLSYLDDDVVVPNNWIAECIRFLRSSPQCGILGCKVIPLFEDESKKPPNFDRWYAGILSLVDLGPTAHELDVRNGTLIVGAGMSGRTCVFRATFADVQSITVGRRGSSLAGGEDLEAQLIASRLGWEIWYTPSLVLQHFVPSRKLNRAYLEKWFIDTAPCHAWLDCLAKFDRCPSTIRLLMSAASLIPRILRLSLVSAIPWRKTNEKREVRFWARQISAILVGYLALIGKRQDMTRVFQFIDKYKVKTIAARQTELAVLAKLKGTSPEVKRAHVHGLFKEGSNGPG